MKKIYDVESVHKHNTYIEAVEAESAAEAFNIVFNKYKQGRITRVTERKTS